MTDIREASAKAAREWRARQLSPREMNMGGILRKFGFNSVDGAACYLDISEAAVEVGYLLGHAAGVTDGARAFGEWCNSHTFPRGVNLSWESRIARFLASRPAPGTDEGTTLADLPAEMRATLSEFDAKCNGTGLCAHTADPLQVDCEKCPVHDGCTPGEYGGSASGMDKWKPTDCNQPVESCDACVFQTSCRHGRQRIAKGTGIAQGKDEED